MLTRRAIDVRQTSADKWLNEHVDHFLREAGVKVGQTVVDFGCGRGTYTIPAARVVGNGGIVYAVEQDKAKIDDLRATAKSAGLENIQIVPATGRANTHLRDESVDVVLLYDVLHSWYHPQSWQRKEILYELYRVLRPDGLLSFYPGDPEVFGHYSELAAIQREIGQVQFRLLRKQATTLIHEGSVVEGHIFIFTKNWRYNHG